MIEVQWWNLQIIDVWNVAYMYEDDNLANPIIYESKMYVENLGVIHVNYHSCVKKSCRKNDLEFNFLKFLLQSKDENINHNSIKVCTA